MKKLYSIHGNQICRTQPIGGLFKLHWRTQLLQLPMIKLLKLNQLLTAIHKVWLVLQT